MRIIAGKYRSLIIGGGDDMSIRPAMDRVREYLFNVIQAQMADALVLDLFAGTGSLGLESLSRGARAVVFVDNGRTALRCIRENLKKLRIDREAEVVTCDVQVFLKKEARCFDIIFCDPPYRYADTDRVVTAIGAGELVIPGGLLIVEHDGEKEGRFAPERFEVMREKSFGRTIISILKKI
jgi:16S rRNA (guanine966-N2)-methyltransferase